MRQLHISKHLSLPIDFVTKTVAVLAQRRKGKTYTASVIAEEMVAAKQPFVVLDPTGAWWGLRASADGKSDGLPVVILGGQHGDVPLERTGGRLVADLVVDEPGYYVIDFSLFESGEAERQFAVDFAERLYRAKGQAGKDFPLHLFVDEADRFVPQQIRKGSKETSTQLLGAFEAIVRRGGLRGLGTTLISQRAAVVNKNVLEMLDILIVLRTLGPNDRTAIEGYINAHGTKEQHDELMGSIGGLDIGEGWVWEPGAEPSLFERVRFRERHTFNSSATPKPGERRIEPRQLAAVDLKVLGDRMAATIEKAKATDPKELNKTIAELRNQIRKLESTKPATETKAKTETRTVEKKVVIEGTITRLEKLIERAEKLRDSFQEGVGALNTEVAQIREALTDARKINDPWAAHVTEKKFGELRGPVSVKIERVNSATGAHSAGMARPSPVTLSPARGTANGDGEISGPMQKILNELAELEAVGISPADKAQLGLFCGYTNVKSGGFTGPLGKLREMELIHYPGSGEVALTDAGRGQAAATGSPLTTIDLQNRIVNKLDGPRAKVLRQLIKLYPDSIDKETLGGQLGYTNVKSGGFTGPLGSLRKLGLIEYPQSGTVVASQLLFPPGLS